MKIEEVLDLLIERQEDWGKSVVQPSRGKVPVNIAYGLTKKQTGLDLDSKEQAHKEGLSGVDKTERSIRGMDFASYLANNSAKNPTTKVRNYIAVFSKRKSAEGIGEDKIIYSLLASVNKKVLENNGISPYVFLCQLAKQFNIKKIQGNIKFKSLFATLTDEEKEKVLSEETIDEEALNREAVWQKEKYSTKQKVREGNGEGIELRKIPASASTATKGEKYVGRMTKGKTNSKGEAHDYTSGGIRQGLHRSTKHLGDAGEKEQTFAIRKSLRKRGLFTDKQINNAFKRGTLEQDERDELLAMKGN